MKRLRDIRRADGITVENANVNWGTGTISFENWRGSVVWGTDEDGWEHVSVSPFDHNTMPSWEDMCRIKDIFWEDEEIAIQFHPKKSQYVNLMENCLHLWRPKDPELLKRLGE